MYTIYVRPCILEKAFAFSHMLYSLAILLATVSTENSSLDLHTAQPIYRSSGVM